MDPNQTIQSPLDPSVTYRFTMLTDSNTPTGKLADAELHFTQGMLAGQKLLGFAIWERRSPSGSRQITFPARTYSVNGERRSFALLRPSQNIDQQDMFKADILAAFDKVYAAYVLGR